MNYHFLFHLRKYVIFCGTKNGWWQHSLIDEGANQILTYIFSRTAPQATYNTAVKIAQKMHDTKIGKDKFHLFRFPNNEEENLHYFLASENCDYSLTANEPNSIAVNYSPNFQQGAFIIQEKDEDTLLAKMLVGYKYAFENNFEIYPYFIHHEFK